MGERGSPGIKGTPGLAVCYHLNMNQMSKFFWKLIINAVYKSKPQYTLISHNINYKPHWQVKYIIFLYLKWNVLVGNIWHLNFDAYYIPKRCYRPQRQTMHPATPQTLIRNCKKKMTNSYRNSSAAKPIEYHRMTPQRPHSLIQKIYNPKLDPTGHPDRSYASVLKGLVMMFWPNSIFLK